MCDCDLWDWNSFVIINLCIDVKSMKLNKNITKDLVNKFCGFPGRVEIIDISTHFFQVNSINKQTQPHKETFCKHHVEFKFMMPVGEVNGY